MSERVDDVQEAREWIREALMEDGPGNDSRAALPARLAQAHATLALVEQQRIANKLAVALVDQLTGIAQCIPRPAAQLDPSIRIRDYLDADEWKGLGI